MAIAITDETRLRLRAEFSIIPVQGDKVLLRSPDQGVRVSVPRMTSEELAGFLRALDGRESRAHPGTGRAAASEVDQLVRGLIQRDIVEMDPSPSAVSSAEHLFANLHDDPRACAKRLDSSRVLVRGEGNLADAVVRDLRAADVGTVARMTSRIDTAACRAADLVVAVSEMGDGRTPDEALLNDEALDSVFSWLPIRIFGSNGFVGPLFIPGDGPCHACLLAREQANWVDPTLTHAYLDHVREAPASLHAYGRLPSFVAITSAWGALEVTKYLSRFTMPAVLGHVMRIDFMRCLVQLHRVLRLPRCPRCSSLATRPSVNSLLYSRAL